MNKEFSNKILICGASNIPAQITHPYNGFLEIHSNVDVKPNVQEKQQNGNPYLDFSLRATATELSPEVKALVKNRRNVIILLFDHSGNHYQVGTQHIPLQAVINTPQFNNEIKFDGRLLTLPY